MIFRTQKTTNILIQKCCEFQIGTIHCIVFVDIRVVISYNIFYTSLCICVHAVIQFLEVEHLFKRLVTIIIITLLNTHTRTHARAHTHIYIHILDRPMCSWLVVGTTLSTRTSKTTVRDNKEPRRSPMAPVN